jgi:hypothetical protein
MGSNQNAFRTTSLVELIRGRTAGQTAPPVSKPGQARRYFDAVQGAVLYSINGSPYSEIQLGDSPSSDAPDWWIDPVNGSDLNNGTTALTPLATHAELRRRIGNFTPIDQLTTINIVNDIPATDPVIVDFTVGPNGSLVYQGIKTLTTLHTGSFTDVSAVDAPNNVATIVEDTTIAGGWGAAGFINTPAGTPMRCRITAGARVGAVGWAVLDLGGTSARTAAWGTLNTTGTPSGNAASREVTPVIADPFVIETDFATIDALTVDLKLTSDVDAGSSRLLFVDLAFNPASERRHQLAELGSRTGEAPVVFSGCATGRVEPFLGVHAAEFSLMNGFFANTVGGAILISGCACLQARDVSEGALASVDVNSLFQGSQISVSGGRVALADAAFFDSGLEGVQVGRGGTVGTTGPVYGEGAATFGIRVSAAASLSYSTAGAGKANLTVTGSTNDVSVAGTASAYGGFGADLSVTGKLAALMADA